MFADACISAAELFAGLGAALGRRSGYARKNEQFQQRKVLPMRTLRMGWCTAGKYSLAAVALSLLPCFGDGLPGDYLVTQRWHYLSAQYSPLSNPAFLADDEYVSARAVYAPMVNNSFYASELGATLPLGLYHSLGFTWARQGESKYPSFDQNFQPTGDSVQFASDGFIFSWAGNIWGRLCLGASVSMIQENRFGATVLSFPPGIDVGISYRLANHPLLGMHRVGIILQNALAPVLDGSAGTETFPRVARLSWNATFMDGKLDAGIDAEAKDLLLDATQFVGSKKDMEYEVASRLSLWLLQYLRLAVLGGLGENNLYYWGVAGGVDAPSFNAGRTLAVLYQFYMMHQAGAHTNGHSISVRAEFGKHREDIFAERMYRYLETSANDLYNKAMTLYYAGKYWDAFWVYGQLLALFPDFFKADMAAYYFHSCEEMLDMRSPAVMGYRTVISQYPTSGAVALADLGIMRVAYREESNEIVQKQYERLTTMQVPDSIRYYAAYFMGETCLRQGQFSQAEELLMSIPAEHPQFPFAQHSLAIALIAQNKNDRAIGNLEKVIEGIPRSPAEEELANRSLLFLGYLAYESQVVKKAVVLLRQIPTTSYYYEDALLGLAWTALKARQWEDCSQTAQVLTKISKKPVMQCEGLLLRSYAAIMKERYNEALDILTLAQKEVEKIAPPSEDTLRSHRLSYSNVRASYDSLAGNAEALSHNRTTPQLVSMIDSMGVHQKKMKSEIDSFLVYADEFHRSEFFVRDAKDLKNDIEYALATADYRVKTAKQRKETEKGMKSVDDINKQIEKAKEEMQKIKGKGQ
jgi:tetratricopeptide (TPR) repeat protein